MGNLPDYIICLPLGLLEVSESNIDDEEGHMLVKSVFDGDVDIEKSDVLVICGNDGLKVESEALGSISKLAVIFDGLDKLWIFTSITENIIQKIVEVKIQNI